MVSRYRPCLFGYTVLLSTLGKYLADQSFANPTHLHTTASKEAVVGAGHIPSGYVKPHHGD